VERRFAPTSGRLDGFLTAWKQEWGIATQQTDKRLFVLGKMFPVTWTDDGRFEIKGVGRERVARVTVTGANIAHMQLWVVTRDGIDARSYNDAALARIPPDLRLPGQPPLLYAPSFDAVAEPTKVIEGTVCDASTGEPVVRASISEFSGNGTTAHALTDDAGRFRLAGAPKVKEYSLHVRPPDSAPLLSRSLRVPDTEGLAPINVEIELPRGAVITGRVIDKATGEGVTGGIRFAPLPDNKYFGTKPGYDTYRYERLMSGVADDGRFR
jgi:hypothetical protein